LPANDSSISRLDHVAYKTSNAEQMRRYLRAHDYAVPAHVEHGSDGSVWVEVSDPEGNRVQFVQVPAHPLSVPVNPLSHHMIHVGYMVHSEAAENAFYEKLLGFRPLWWGGGHDNSRDWISHQVPDGPDWVEYMITHAPQKTGIPPSMTRAGLGSMDHFSLGVPNMEKAVDLLYNGGRMDPKNSPKIGRDAKWQFNEFDPDQTRAELMEFQPIGKPCCSPFTAKNPTE
jgi:catechol 2,3-dioxygenase-like lactoylglutathione lyase family enzyme